MLYPYSSYNMNGTLSANYNQPSLVPSWRSNGEEANRELAKAVVFGFPNSSKAGK